LDLVAVSALEFGELGGEGAHHAAGGAVGRLCGRPRRPASLLDPQLLDTSADLGGPVEEVEPDVSSPIGCPVRAVNACCRSYLIGALLRIDPSEAAGAVLAAARRAE